MTYLEYSVSGLLLIATVVRPLSFDDKKLLQLNYGTDVIRDDGFAIICFKPADMRLVRFWDGLWFLVSKVHFKSDSLFSLTNVLIFVMPGIWLVRELSFKDDDLDKRTHNN